MLVGESTNDFVRSALILEKTQAMHNHKKYFL